jgi:hypothetical protein
MLHIEPMNQQSAQRHMVLEHGEDLLDAFGNLNVPAGFAPHIQENLPKSFHFSSLGSQLLKGTEFLSNIMAAYQQICWFFPSPAPKHPPNWSNLGTDSPNGVWHALCISERPDPLSQHCGSSINPKTNPAIGDSNERIRTA